MDIIAEIGQAHEGSLGIAHSYIDALAETGITAVKFQTHVAEAESSEFENFRVKFSYEDKTRFDYWKRMEFTIEQWAGLKQHCEDKNLEFISSPFSNKAVDLLEQIGVQRYKIGSGEVSNYLMLEKISKTNKPILLSSGMSSYDELDKTVDFIKERGNDLSLFQCTTSYPSISGEWGLNLIPDFINKYNVPIGFSDHSGDIYSCLAATTLGASLLEFHVVFDKQMFGPDAKSSLTISEIKKLTKGVSQISNDLKSSSNFKLDNSKFNELKSIFEKSLAVNKDLKAGNVITFDDLEAKKPANMGITAKEFESIIGKKLNIDLKKWDFIQKNNLIN
ncbi:N-acetylneuraminate synthase family protein [Polaribacter pectinis]|uniref:N-acetylneuraminate synthase family protein n=1 Tax=Polaribacter pectinis TaxID=2738844 RepID=A0A7G9LAX0_9FLAO|nr:N-acetylneuraminate synthase family protein [Polaribacter pectinis]QNM85769.1 N-acetylneuraminate synthase family protein [Polaribacter pectinis]